MFDENVPIMKPRVAGPDDGSSRAGGKPASPEVWTTAIFDFRIARAMRRDARWALFVGDGKRGAHEMMGYYHPCIFGIHPHHPGFNDIYPLYVADEIFDCCRGSRRRHEGKYHPSRGKEDWYREWGDENELVRRLKYWADPEAPPPMPFSQIMLRREAEGAGGWRHS